MRVIIIPIYKLTNTENLKNLPKTTIDDSILNKKHFFFVQKKIEILDS